MGLMNELRLLTASKLHHRMMQCSRCIAKIASRIDSLELQPSYRVLMRMDTNGCPEFKKVSGVWAVHKTGKNHCFRRNSYSILHSCSLIIHRIQVSEIQITEWLGYGKEFECVGSSLSFQAFPFYYIQLITLKGCVLFRYRLLIWKQTT